MRTARIESALSFTFLALHRNSLRVQAWTGERLNLLSAEPNELRTASMGSLRLCLYRKKISLSTCLTGQALGIEEVSEGV
jgi:hypothetical protein